MSFWKQSSRLQAAATMAAASFICKPASSKTEASIQPINKTSPFPGLSPITPVYVFQPNPYLEIAFDTRTRNPIYVMERLFPQRSRDNPQSLKRPSNFYEEKSLPEEFRSRAQHYKNSGFDRGHLAAAANYMQRNQKELNDTFNLINVSPQNHSMNCSIWAQLERWALKVADENQDADIYVVSGPLWMPLKQTGQKLFEFHYSAIGNPPSLVSVPTHFYKVVVAVDRKSKQLFKFACFVVPNAEFDKSSNRRSLEDFLVPWTSLEAVTGLHFFPALVEDPNWKEKANQLTLEIMKPREQHLLLTDGAKSGRGMWRVKSSQLCHLCANGKCQ